MTIKLAKNSDLQLSVVMTKVKMFTEKIIFHQINLVLWISVQSS